MPTSTSSRLRPPWLVALVLASDAMLGTQMLERRLTATRANSGRPSLDSPRCALHESVVRFAVRCLQGHPLSENLVFGALCGFFSLFFKINKLFGVWCLVFGVRVVFFRARAENSKTQKHKARRRQNTREKCSSDAVRAMFSPNFGRAEKKTQSRKKGKNNARATRTNTRTHT